MLVPIAGTYSFHSGATALTAFVNQRKLRRPLLRHEVTASANNDRPSILWREVRSLYGVRPPQCVVVPPPGPVGISMAFGNRRQAALGEVASVEASERDQV